MIIIESAGLSEIGKKRRDNEDSMLVDDALLLYAVADGMGGHQAGEVASQLAVDTLRAHIRNPRKNGQGSLPSKDKSLSRQANHLLTGIHLSNHVVHTCSRSNSDYEGMGTTVAAVCLSNDTIIAANVGDSKIYLVRNGEISQISVQHTLLAEQSAVNEELAERLGREFSHVLTRAVGTHAEVKPDISELQCLANDILIISSDGLTDKASPSEIQAIAQADPPQAACLRLIELANDRGGDDNITAVVVKVRQIMPHRYSGSQLWRRIKNKFRRKN